MTKKFFGAQSMLIGSPLQSATDPETSSPPSAGVPTSGDDWGLDHLIDNIEAWWGQMDAAFAKGIQARPEPISCDTCPHEEPGCCFQKVVVTIYDILPIVRFLLRQKRDTPRLRAQLDEAGVVMEATDRDSFFHAAHPCVFLEHGKCSIYEVRPTMCRSYFVISDPSQCQPGTNEEILKINDGAYVNELLIIAKKVHALLGLKETRKRIFMGALPRMVLMGLQMWEADDFRAFVRSQPWPADDTLQGWIDQGINPFQERLYQIRSAKE